MTQQQAAPALASCLNQRSSRRAAQGRRERKGELVCQRQQSLRALRVNQSFGDDGGAGRFTKLRAQSFKPALFLFLKCKKIVSWKLPSFFAMEAPFVFQFVLPASPEAVGPLGNAPAQSSASPDGLLDFPRMIKHHLHFNHQSLADQDDASFRLRMHRGGKWRHAVMIDVFPLFCVVHTQALIVARRASSTLGARTRRRLVENMTWHAKVSFVSTMT